MNDNNPPNSGGRPPRRFSLVLLVAVAAIASLAVVGAVLLGSGVDVGDATVYSSPLSANDVRDATRALFADRGWEFVTSRGTQRAWSHVAEDADGNQISVVTTFGSLQLSTTVSKDPDFQCDPAEVARELARRLSH